MSYSSNCTAKKVTESYSLDDEKSEKISGAKFS